jgi:hypothetical protein
VSSTTTRDGATGVALDAALDATVVAALGGCDEMGAIEADAALVGVPAVDAVGGDEGAADDATGGDVDVLACFEPELQAVATVASATRAATRR